MKPGRNDPCPCGSGKKYKHCCLAANAGMAESPQELTWRRLRRVLEGYPAAVLRFIGNVYGPEAIDEAWDEYWLGAGEDGDGVSVFDPDTPHMQIFMPWFFHAWAPDPDVTSITDTSLHHRKPTQVYLERKGTKLDPLLRRYLTECVATPFSFYEILHAVPGHGFTVRDVFTGGKREVLERSASMIMQAGDLFYGLLVETDGITLLEACPPCSIPPGEKVTLIDLRQKMGAGQDLFPSDLLWEWDIELREIHLDIMERLLNPRMPELRNTDGEALAPQQLVFDIESPDSTFDALWPLALGETRETLLEEAQWNATGGLSRVEFDWGKRGNNMHASWDNTILGRVAIDGHCLTVDVNSAGRAAAFRDIVERALGDKACYRETTFESLERALDEHLAGDELPTASETESLMELPEVKAKITEMVEAHYENWIAEKVPALGNRTPLAAVRDADGREQVEALIRQMERSNEKQGFAVGADVFTRLRTRLGLV